jgi:hypothetical protein
MFDVERSMFNVQPLHCSGRVQFHTSVASGRERPVKSKKKLMNIEHRTSNIEHRKMYSVRL